MSALVNLMSISHTYHSKLGSLRHIEQSQKVGRLLPDINK